MAHMNIDELPIGTIIDVMHIDDTGSYIVTLGNTHHGRSSTVLTHTHKKKDTTMQLCHMHDRPLDFPTQMQ